MTPIPEIKSNVDVLVSDLFLDPTLYLGTSWVRAQNYDASPGAKNDVFFL